MSRVFIHSKLIVKITLLISLSYLHVYAQDGVTVITHGFMPGGNSVIPWISGIESQINMAKEIQKRAKVEGRKSIVYTNNIGTGQWEVVSPLVYPKNVSLSTPTETIFVYNWTIQSNNILAGLDGQLEGASDNLFALLCASQAGNIFEGTAHLHFIGHSRGCPMLLQVFHRVAKYYPNRAIQHFTMLDPHPASTMNDVSMSNESLSLPGVYGLPTDCFLTCSGSGNMSIKLSKNVQRADNYYRADGGYENDFRNVKKYFPLDFDGITVENLGIMNRKLINTLIQNGSPTSIPPHISHSNIVTWYTETIPKDSIAPSNTKWFDTNPATNTNWIIELLQR